MSLVDVIKWEANDGDFCYKYPSDDISLGAQLVVYAGQTAFFVNGGKICDRFEAGTYTITTDNIPVLDRLINIPFGGESPFKAEVWFVNMVSKLDLKWGTPSPLQIEDPKYSIIVPVSAYGQYGIRVSDARLFLETLIGNMPGFTVSQIEAYFKGKLLSRLNSIISRKILEDKVSVLDINSHIVSMSSFCEEELGHVFFKYGVSVIEFSIISVTVPENDPSIIKLKAAKDMAARLKITGKDVYRMERMYDVLEAAASNEGSGGEILSIGAGLGAGIGLGSAIRDMSADAGIPREIRMPTKRYYVYSGGQQTGNLSAEEVMENIACKNFSADSFVWVSGMQEWVRLSAMPEFSRLFASDESQLPPPLPDIK